MFVRHDDDDKAKVVALLLLMLLLLSDLLILLLLSFLFAPPRTTSRLRGTVPYVPRVTSFSIAPRKGPMSPCVFHISKSREGEGGDDDEGGDEDEEQELFFFLERGRAAREQTNAQKSERCPSLSTQPRRTTSWRRTWRRDAPPGFFG